MAKKSISIVELVDMVNLICKDSDADCVMIRQGAINVLTAALHSTKNYKGYRYLVQNEVRHGNPGIREGEDFDRFDRTDCTRVQYFK